MVYALSIFFAATLLAFTLCACAASSKKPSTSASVLGWMGHNWNLTNGGMAGVIQGKSSNIFVDANRYLHLRITKSGSTWTGSEMFTQDNLGFGTYQWVLQGANFYNMDKPIVLGLFPYGPQAGIGVDGENEIDAEFSHWNGDFGSKPVNADFTYYPSTGNGPNASFEDDFQVNMPAPSTTTVRMVWTSSTIDSYIMSGTVPVTSAPTNIIKHDTFKGSTTTIPQDAVPLGVNLWSYHAEPTNSWDIVMQSFEFVHQ